MESFCDIFSFKLRVKFKMRVRLLVRFEGNKKKQREKNRKIFLDDIIGEVERRTFRQATSHS